MVYIGSSTEYKKFIKDIKNAFVNSRKEYGKKLSTEEKGCLTGEAVLKTILSNKFIMMDPVLKNNIDLITEVVSFISDHMVEIDTSQCSLKSVNPPSVHISVETKFKVTIPSTKEIINRILFPFTYYRFFNNEVCRGLEVSVNKFNYVIDSQELFVILTEIATLCKSIDESERRYFVEYACRLPIHRQFKLKYDKKHDEFYLQFSGAKKRKGE